MLGKILRSLRESREYTQKDLATMIGLTPKMISFYEKEQRQPPIDVLLKLANIFHVSTDYLLKGSGSDSLPQPRQEADEVMLKKFHALDQRGQENVLNILDMEYQRVLPQLEKKEIS